VAETAPIAEIADKLSKELFAEFLWTRTGPINQDWACLQTDAHDATTHPTDVVFIYDEPYGRRRTYLQCDLKSYARGSITAGAIKKAVISLSRQVSCAELSEDWQRLYTTGDGDFDVCGLLFVYNHDGDYDKDFKWIIDQIKWDDLDVPTRSRLYVIGPDDIRWLDNVRLDIRQMRGAEGAGSLPSREFCSFYYPQLSRKANIQNADARAATLEMLTSPWVTLKYQGENDHDERYVVFARRAADRPEEYEYLIDYLRHYQCLEKPNCVTVKVLAEGAQSAVVWGQAVERYIRNVVAGNSDSQFAKIVKSISFQPMEQMVSRFSSVAIGMNDV